MHDSTADPRPRVGLFPGRPALSMHDRELEVLRGPALDTQLVDRGGRGLHRLHDWLRKGLSVETRGIMRTEASG